MCLLMHWLLLFLFRIILHKIHNTINGVGTSLFIPLLDMSHSTKMGGSPMPRPSGSINVLNTWRLFAKLLKTPPVWAVNISWQDLYWILTDWWEFIAALFIWSVKMLLLDLTLLFEVVLFNRLNIASSLLLAFRPPNCCKILSMFLLARCTLFLSLFISKDWSWTLTSRYSSFSAKSLRRALNQI